MLIGISFVTTAHAQTTAFTYQGELNVGGTPANGGFDVRFGLFANAAGGTQIGNSQTISSVPVGDGIFTVQLDFGVDAFPGANRFVEIAVRPAGSGSFTTLAPRQQISSSPYAIRTLIASNAEQLGGLPASRYVQSDANGSVELGTPAVSHGKLSVSGGTSSAVYGESTTGRGIWGKSASSRGVYGESDTFQGVYGVSNTQAGVAGESNSFHAVFGSAHTQNSSGVYGTNDAGGFGVTGSSTTGANGTGVYGESSTGTGVRGRSVTGEGLRGASDSGRGVVGESATGNAIVGEAHSANNAGVFGSNDAANSYGVRGANTGSGGVAVYGEAATGRGVWGKSVSSRGVYGESQSFQGVFGGSNTSTGVHGESAGTNGFGVYAKNLNGFAIGAEGNATQNRDKGGWIKAMAYVGADGSTIRCYNSFLAGAAGSTGSCGFDIEKITLVSDEPAYEIDFNFQINDRFVVVTPVKPDFASVSATFRFVNSPDEVWVYLFESGAEPFDDYIEAPFMIVVL